MIIDVLLNFIYCEGRFKTILLYLDTINAVSYKITQICVIQEEIVIEYNNDNNIVKAILRVSKPSYKISSS